MIFGKPITFGAAQVAIRAKVGINGVSGQLKGVAANANAANSVPALRAQVAELAEMVRLLAEKGGE